MGLRRATEVLLPLAGRSASETHMHLVCNGSAGGRWPATALNRGIDAGSRVGRSSIPASVTGYRCRCLRSGARRSRHSTTATAVPTHPLFAFLMRARSRWPSRKHSASSASRCSTSSGGRRRTGAGKQRHDDPERHPTPAGTGCRTRGVVRRPSLRLRPGDRPSIEYRLGGQPGGRLQHRAGGGWCRADDHQTQGCGGSHLHPRFQTGPPGRCSGGRCQETCRPQRCPRPGGRRRLRCGRAASP